MNADLNNANKTNRRRTVKTRSRFTTLLTVYFFVALIIPNCVLANTEPYSVWTVEALILMPLGFYMMWSVALRRSGVMIWLAFPFIFFCAFQIVLLYLFGNSIIATDMFTNLLTTNPGEAGELLGNIYPSVVLVCVIYLPLLWLAAREIGHKRYITRTARMNIGLTGAALFAVGLLALWPAYHVSEERHVLRDEIFPLNIMYNLGLSGSEFRKSYNFHKTSEGFTYEAERTAEAPGREVYVYIIGEASRAMNWQLYGYGRETNPLLSGVGDLVVFRDVLTQSNTTHKSVPLILSSVATGEHEELYRRKGLPALFNEAGFDTWFISNQSPQGAMIDHLAHDARHVIYIRSPRHDMQLLDEMRKALERSTSQKLLFVLHCYGSHFSYHQRYPREFAHFQPDNDVAIARQHRPMLVNAYDNSIRYTDYFLAQTIDYLRSLKGTSSALLYCADHGEDLIDDDHGLSALRGVAGLVLGGLPDSFPRKGRRRRGQRDGSRDDPRAVSHDGRHGFDPRTVPHDEGLARKPRFRPHGSAPLPERPQRSRALPQDGPAARGHGGVPEIRNRTLGSDFRRLFPHIPRFRFQRRLFAPERNAARMGSIKTPIRTA